MATIEAQMTVRALVQRFLVAVVGGLLACAAGAQQPAPAYEPTPGQPGKDVVWVPMPDSQVERLLDLAKVTARDFVMDLGSGDGRTVIAAAKRGARAMGVEFNPDLVELSRHRAREAGVTDRTAFVEGDLFKADLSRATVITLFLLDDINVRLRPTLLALKPGTRVATNTFKMGDWEPDAETGAPGCYAWCFIYLWIVPARVEGTWRTPEGELALTQQYQNVSGTLGAGPLAVPVRGRLVGDRISFSAAGAEYRGRVAGSSIEGTVASGGGIRPWTAARAGAPGGRQPREVIP
jgi:SAM-dependent methyltransferase